MRELHVGGIPLGILDSVEVCPRDIYHAYLRPILRRWASVVPGQAWQIRGGHAEHCAECFQRRRRREDTLLAWQADLTRHQSTSNQWVLIILLVGINPFH